MYKGIAASSGQQQLGRQYVMHKAPSHNVQASLQTTYAAALAALTALSQAAPRAHLLPAPPPHIVPRAAPQACAATRPVPSASHQSPVRQTPQVFALRDAAWRCLRRLPACRFQCLRHGATSETATSTGAWKRASIFVPLSNETRWQAQHGRVDA